MATRADTQLWAKRQGTGTPYPLLCHLLDTAAAAAVLWDHWLRPGLRELLTAAIAPGNEDLAQRRFAAVAGLHDLGKANAIFQGQTLSPHTEPWTAAFQELLAASGYAAAPEHADIPDTALACARRHEVISRRALGEVPECDEDPTTSWAQAVAGSHHGKTHMYDDRAQLIDETVTALCGGQWGTQQHAHLRAVLDATGLDDLPPALVGARATALVLLTGLTSLADWFASYDASVAGGHALLLTTTDPTTDPGAWVKARTAWFLERLPDTFDTYHPLTQPREQILGEHATSLSPLQRDAENVTGGLWVVTCPTGDGKTEAALLRHAAAPEEGIIFALPTRSTADAMMARVRGAFTGTANSANLSHGYAALNDFYAPPQVALDSDNDRACGLTPSDWLSGRLMSLLAPVTVATCDQVLAGALRQRWSAMRLLATANRHVVLDEVHTYDHFQSHLLAVLLTWWGHTGTRVTLLSATLPTWQRNKFVTAYSPNHPEVADADARFPSHTVVEPGVVREPSLPAPRFSYSLAFDAHSSTSQADDHVSWVAAQRAAHPDARIAVVVNTVGRCVEVAEKLQHLGHTVLVLHSRMLAGHRNERSALLTRLLGKSDDTGQGLGKGVTVVGTQVIEASLDIDFDLMSSDLAPAPSLIQRAGRLWRHTDPRRESRLPGQAVRTLRVVAATTRSGTLADRAQAPYLTGEQARTLAAITHRDALDIPAGVQQFVDEAAFSWADALDASGDTAPGAGEEIVARLKRIAAAEQLVLPLHEYLARPTYGHLTHMTARNEDAETSTRYSETVSNTYLLIDPTGHTPHAWPKTTQELAATTRRGDLRTALRATLPANGATDRALMAAHLATAPNWTPRAALLRHLLPVDLTHAPGLTYSPTTGLRMKDTP